jgi:hypothetical protein
MNRAQKIEQAALKVCELWSMGAKSYGEMCALQDALALPEDAKAVAWLFQHEDTGLTDCIDNQQVEWGFEKNNPRWQKIAPLYTHPPKADAVCEICAMDVVGSWVNIDDVSRLAKQLDTAMNGKDAAEDPSLTDVIAQAVKILKPKAVDAELVRRINLCQNGVGSSYELLTDLRKRLTGEK